MLGQMVLGTAGGLYDVRHMTRMRNNPTYHLPVSLLVQVLTHPMNDDCRIHGLARGEGERFPGTARPFDTALNDN